MRLKKISVLFFLFIHSKTSSFQILCCLVHFIHQIHFFFSHKRRSQLCTIQEWGEILYEIALSFYPKDCFQILIVWSVNDGSVRLRNSVRQVSGKKDQISGAVFPALYKVSLGLEIQLIWPFLASSRLFYHWRTTRYINI